MHIEPSGTITLRKNADKRVRKGHAWVFSNEIAEPAVSSLVTGGIYYLTDHSNEFIGMVYANPASLISARILAGRRMEISDQFITTRITEAWERRKSVYGNADAFRVVFGEADLLPGLIIDKYKSTFVVQVLTAGMERFKDWIISAITQLADPECIFFRNDSSSRALEGLEVEKKLAYGNIPDELIIESNGIQFLIDIVEGQKTGFFLDQEYNRHLAARYTSPGARVLDLFSYSGGWGITAAKAEIEEVVLVDSSQPALDLALRNAELNNVAERLSVRKASVFDFLKSDRGGWDLIIADPPAFIKSRSQIKEGTKGYIDLNRRAMSKLKQGGVLISCSCSHHMDRDSFESLLHTASRQSGRDLRILEIRGQGPDHPVLMAMPESRYLKVIALQVV